MSATAAGWGKEDDCVTVRLYLPGRWDLVAQQAEDFVAKDSLITIDDIKDLMVGVHFAAMTEAMAFCEHFGVDTDLMFDIVDNAAGVTVVFTRTFKEIQKAKWSLKPAPGGAKIRNGLVSHRFGLVAVFANWEQARAVQNTFDLRYPVFLASAALQAFDRQLR